MCVVSSPQHVYLELSIIVSIIELKTINQFFILKMNASHFYLCKLTVSCFLEQMCVSRSRIKYATHHPQV